MDLEVLERPVGRKFLDEKSQLQSLFFGEHYYRHKASDNLCAVFFSLVFVF